MIFKPQGEKKQLFAHDAERAVELMKRRDPLPPAFTESTVFTDIPEGLLSARKLVIKHETADDLMRRTLNAEG